MADRHTNAPARDHPVAAMLLPFPVACFIGALITDIVYWRNPAVMWETFSIWLLFAGLVTAAIVVLVVGIHFLVNRRTREAKPSWPRLIGIGIALVLAIINAFVHSRDGYTAVVPTGLTLSAIVVLLLLFTGWIGRTIVSPEVSPAGAPHQQGVTS